MGNGNDGFNPFDVLEELKNTGFQQNQAESLAKIFSDVEFRNIATKQDIEEVKRDIKGLELKIENVKSELKRDIKELEARMKLHMMITSGGMAFLILGSIVTLAQLGLLTPTP